MAGSHKDQTPGGRKAAVRVLLAGSQAYSLSHFTTLRGTLAPGPGLLPGDLVERVLEWLDTQGPQSECAGS